jgi:nitrite reductase/ring-hydroxylating ferredoxin subunit
MKILRRIFGICETKPPENPDCWNYSSGKVEIELSKVPKLNEKNSAIRLEGKGLPNRLLVVHGDDDVYHVFENKCTHFGRRLDPLPGKRLIQCCSIGKSTFDYTGANVSGSAKEPTRLFPVEKQNGVLIIKLV